MPNRILRDGIISSLRFSVMSQGAQLFYYKLISVVDDYGRYDGYPEVLRARCYAFELDHVTVADVSRWLEECGQKPANVRQLPLITAYTVDGKKYLQINNFGQRERTERFPSPSLADKSEQLLTNAARATNTNTNTNSSESYSKLSTTEQSSLPKTQRRNRVSIFKSEQQKTAFEEFWGAYWRKTHRKSAEIAYVKAISSTGAHRKAMEAIKAQMATMIARDVENRPHAATWLNGERWNDLVERTPKLGARNHSKSGIEKLAAHEAWRMTFPEDSRPLPLTEAEQQRVLGDS